MSLPRIVGVKKLDHDLSSSHSDSNSSFRLQNSGTPTTYELNRKSSSLDVEKKASWSDGPKKLSTITKIGDGSGHVLNDLCASLWFSYLLLYLQNVVKLSSDYAAGLLLLGQVVDAAATPLIGYCADRAFNCCLCKRAYGQCKSWHLFGVILVLFSFPFVFSPSIGFSDAEDWVKFLYYAPFIAIFQIGWASTQVSHLALLPKMSPNELVRTELLAIRYGFTVASNVTVFVIAWLTFGFTQDCKIDADDDSKFRNLALIAVFLGSLFVIFYHVIIKEDSAEEIELNSRLEMERQLEKRTKKAAAVAEAVTNDKQNFTHEIKDTILKNFRPAKILSTKALSLGKTRMSIRDWLTLPQFYIVAAIYMATRLSVNVTQVYVPLYLQESLKLPCGTVATIPLTMYISGFMVALIIKFVNKYLGRQLSYIFGAVLSVLGSFMIICLDWNSSEFLRAYGIYGVATLLGGGASAILVTSLSITADMIGNNTENGAIVFGVMSFTDKLSCGLAVMLINSLLPSSSTVTGSDFYTVNFYRNVVGYTCGGCALVGVLSVLALSYRIYYQEKGNKDKNIIQVQI